MKKALHTYLFPIALLTVISANLVSAATIIVGGTSDPTSGMTTSFTGAHVDTFDNGLLPSNYAAGNASALVSGNSAGVYAAPANDKTKYLTTGSGAVSISYANAISYFGLYWGSVDSYNYIQFKKTDGTTETFTGSSLGPFGVTVDGAHSAYVNFTDNSGLGWKQVSLYSAQNAFELDNVATATPEPGSLAMLGAGLVALGVIARKRKSANS